MTTTSQSELKISQTSPIITNPTTAGSHAAGSHEQDPTSRIPQQDPTTPTRTTTGTTTKATETSETTSHSDTTGYFDYRSQSDDFIFCDFKGILDDRLVIRIQYIYEKKNCF